MSFYLKRCDFMTDLTKEQWVCIRYCAKVRKSATETLEVIRQALGEESMSHTEVFVWHVQTEAKKSGDRWRAKARVCSLFSLTSRGLFTMNLYWQVSQFHILLWCVTLTAWKCGKTSPETLKTELAVASWQHSVSHFPFHQEVFTKKQHDCQPPPYSPDLDPCNFFLYPQLEHKTERQSFWYNSDDRDEVGGTCGTNGGEEERV
jgi:hypothetical protein